jgi:hypothetical protein
MATKTATTKAPVARQALIARINRKLAHDSEKLRKSSAKSESTLGEYYVVSTEPGASGVIHTDVDVEDWARELGVLQPWEEVAD